ncbi:hypothetical protein [Oceanobacillus sp. CAU 1775]
MKNILVLMTLFCFLFLFACTNDKSQTLESFYERASMENVDKIIFVDGSTGFSKVITKQEQISEFLSLTNDIVFTPQKNQENRDGWLYNVTLFDGNKEFSFTLNKIGDTYYDSNPNVYPIVEKYYKNLEDNEK